MNLRFEKAESERNRLKDENEKLEIRVSKLMSLPIFCLLSCCFSLCFITIYILAIESLTDLFYVRHGEIVDARFLCVHTYRNHYDTSF